jgi:hypothetical protein
MQRVLLVHSLCQGLQLAAAACSSGKAAFSTSSRRYSAVYLARRTTQEELVS